MGCSLYFQGSHKLCLCYYSGSSAWQTLFSRALGTVGFTRKRRNKRHPPTETVKYPWGSAWPHWLPRTPHHGRSEVTSCTLLLQGEPAQVPGQRSRRPKQVCRSLVLPLEVSENPLQTLPQSCQLKKQMEHTGWWALLYLPGHFQRQGYIGSLPKPLQFQHLLHY